ncbi:hypothetical protein H7U37_07660 [Pseudoflavonifractor phocaeensis]|uniref:hypothetical protein n=1 Tax=Pseudoflavonifractor phocaeensis TaxID=1870988 RepID=UPI00195880A3|nr:hypothetical protein [Pseudoflavonifractor phocaeensis]MBM6938401.1 hypothetical protein [Pseudoflavonifractor phocaeensis]
MSEEKKPARPLRRFGWFAASHVLVSLLTLLFFMVLLGMSSIMNDEWMFLLIFLELLALWGYWGMGAYLARHRGWAAFSGPKEFCGAMLRPAVIAWLWGGAVLAMVFGIGFYLPEGAAADILATTGGIIAWVSVVLCAPSSLLVLLWFAFGVSQTWAAWSLAVLLLLAGGLPPLLFTLGSAWGSAAPDRRKGPLLAGIALTAALGLFLVGAAASTMSGHGLGFGPGAQDWRYELTGGYRLMRVNSCTIVLTTEEGEIVVDGYVSAFADTGKDIFVRGISLPLEDPDDHPEAEDCLWYWVDAGAGAKYGPYRSAQALEEAANAQGVEVPDPTWWTDTYPAPSGARYD